MQFAAAMFAIFMARAPEPLCIVAGHVPDLTTCLIAEYIDALGNLAQAEADAAQLGDSTSTEARAFYAMKARMQAERLALAQFRPYLGVGDKQVAKGARYVVSGMLLLFKWDSTGQEDFRRIVRFEMPPAELTEKTAEIKLHQKQTLDVLIAMSGAVLDANIDQTKGQKTYSLRRMTSVERDSLVARLERLFPGQLKADSNGDWRSGWAATAASIRKSLVEGGWQFRQPKRAP